MNKNFSSELAYVLGLVLLAIGTALMTKANFGVSMIVAPAYILHLKVSEFLPWFSFGVAEYAIQALLLVATVAVVGKFKWYYLFSFVTAILYGLALDGVILVLDLVVWEHLALRIGAFAVGLALCTTAIALLINTYLAPEVYELFVKELSAKRGVSFGRVKIVYDVTSLLVAAAMTVVFFGWWPLHGIGIGTVVTAILNGWLIAIISKWLNKKFNFVDGLPLRKYFS